VRNLSDTLFSGDGSHPGLPGSSENTLAALFSPLFIGYLADALFGRNTPMAKDYEGDYQFGSASQFDKSFRDLSLSFNHPAIKEIALVFERSIERVISINTLPTELIYWSAFNMQTLCIARANLGLRADDESTPPEVQAEHLKVWNKMVATAQHGTDVGAALVWKYGSLYLKQFLHKATVLRNDPKIGRQEHIFGGVESLLSAMLLGAYAAFETAAADLWVELVNSDPSSPENWLEKNPNKNFSPADLIGYNFNLSGKMGTYLFRSQKASFQSLNDVRSNYSGAFKGAADSCFEPAKNLVEAEKIRHLLAHRGGVIDAKFKKEMQNYADYSNQVIGSYVDVNGPMVCRNIEASVKATVQLLKFGDAHLRKLTSPNG
jgi:hypothetical protein